MATGSVIQDLVAWFHALDLPGQALALAALPIAATLSGWFLLKIPAGARWLARGLRKWRLRLQTRRAMPQILDAYRKQIERQTLGIRHAWMPRDRTIADLIVPPLGRTDDAASSDVFDYFLVQFREKRRAIHVFTGSPGGGKSTALAIAVRAAWESLEGSESGGIERMPTFIPILLQFSDIADSTRKHDNQQNDSFALGKRIEAVLLAGLEHAMFAHDHARGQAIREQFLSEVLADGRLLLVIDGLDVLPRSERDSTLRNILSFVGTRHFCLIGCRDEVFPEHRKVLEGYGAKRLHLLGFTQSTSERFLRKWAMITGQAAEHPLDFLADRAAQRRIVENPLLLTIACFLKTRETVGDLHRVIDFYQECSEALLTNWDKETGTSRNHQQRQSYEQHLLGRLAQWQVGSDDVTSGLDRSKVHKLFRDWIKQDLDPTAAMGTEVKILNELVVHSGLLVVLDSGRIDFLHRTFMEYFAARRYAEERSSVEDLKRVWKSDPVRHERLASFYCSLADDGITAEYFGELALQRHDVRFAINLIAQGGRIEEPLHGRIAEAVKAQLPRPSVELIEALGDLSRCSSDAAAREAKSQLQSLFEQRNHFPQAIVEAVLREVLADSEQGTAALISCGDQVRLPHVIAGLKARTIASIGRAMILDESKPARICQWIACLRQTEQFNELLETFSSLNSPRLRAEAAMALASLSCADGFWHAFDSKRGAENAGDQEALPLLARWGWPHPQPATPAGKRTALQIAQCLAGALPRSEFPFRPLDIAVHHWLYFAVHALAWERHYPDTPMNHGASRNEWKAPVVTMMFRSMPALVRRAWVNHQTLKVRSHSKVTRALRWAAMFAPLALLIVLLVDIGSSLKAGMQVPGHVAVAGACLLAGDVLGWIWIALHPGREYGLRTPLDLVVASILGPAFVLRELPREVSSKRRDDRFVICWAAAMILLMGATMLFADALEYSMLGLLVACDALIQANNRVGAFAWSSIQCDAMTYYLSNGCMPDAS